MTEQQLLKNGTRVTTPEGEGVIRSTIGGFYGYYYTVQLDDGPIHTINGAEVKAIEIDS